MLANQTTRAYLGMTMVLLAVGGMLGVIYDTPISPLVAGVFLTGFWLGRDSE